MDYVCVSTVLQPLNITISRSPTSTLIAGVEHTLTCMVTIEEHFQGATTLMWRLPQNSPDISIGRQSTTEVMSTIVLSFSPLRTSHGGVYVCQVMVNISGIAPLTQTANETLHVQSKLLK